MATEFRDAEDALAHFLERVGAGESLDFEAFCATLPQFADALRAQMASLRALESVVQHNAQRPGPPRADAGVGPQLARTLKQLRKDGHAQVRYELRGEIGRGGMGIVHRAWDNVLKREVALKHIRIDVAGSASKRPSSLEPRSIGRFVEEAQITAQLDHPSIIPIHDVGYDEHGDLFFTMRLIEGRDLNDVLREHAAKSERWTTARVADVLLRVCETLAFAHSKGVVHRDLKPANVRIGEFGAVYVIDWGLARILDAVQQDAQRASVPLETDRSADRDSGSGMLTQLGDVVGTLAYMAPEQALGAVPGPASDIYAAGALLYELLSGRAPYAQPVPPSNPRQLLERVLEGPPEPLEKLAPDAPPELIAICNKAMSRAARERFANAMDLADELRAFLEGRVVRSHRADLPTVLRKWVERNRVLAGTVTAAVAVLVVALFVFIARLETEVEATRLALAQRDQTTRERNRYDHRLRADNLVERAESLYPAVASTVPAMQDWLDETDVLLRERDIHASDRATLAATAPTYVVELLDNALSAFERLAAARANVAERLQRAETLERRSLVDHELAWSDAIEALAADDDYADTHGRPLELAAQLGLVPLGENPQSGLWEFFVLDSGVQPTVRDDATGRWELGLDSGIVLVLVPGMANHAVPCHPCFVGKYEVTQGQWRLAMGSNPSDRCSDRSSAKAGEFWPFDDRHPVENVTWLEARRYAQRLGVRLMSRKQWVRFAGGRGESPRWTGDDVMSLIGRENVLFDPDNTQHDQADRYAFHAPVGSFAANDFGGFDLLGNVAELCREASQELREGQSALDPTLMHLLGAGDFRALLAECSTNTRHVMRADWKNYSTGLRVARPIVPCPWCQLEGRVGPDCGDD